MKKLLIVILSLLLLVGCTAKKEEEVPEEEAVEPIGYKGPYYLKGTSKFELEDLKNHKIGLTEYFGSEANEFVLKDLEQYGVSEDNIVYMFSYNDIIDNINGKNIDCFLIDSELEGAINDFRDNYNPDDYKLIKSYDVPVYEVDEYEEELKENYLLNHPFAIMLTGVDESVPPTTTSGVRTDVNILMVVEPELHHVLTISFPRDSYMRSSMYGYYDKMNAFVQHGIEDTKDSVGETLGVEVPYFMQTSFSSFVNLINFIGGLWVHVPYDVYMDQDSTRNVGQPYEVDKGYQKLYGEWALALARNRKYAGLVGGDYGRIRNQALLVNELIARLTQYPTLLKYLYMLHIYQDYVYTNLESWDIEALINYIEEFKEGYTIDNYFIENVGDTVNGSFVGYMPQYTLDIAKGKIDLVMNKKIDPNNPYYEEILTGYVSGGAGTSADGGYIGEEYDLRKVFNVK